MSSLLFTCQKKNEEEEKQDDMKCLTLSVFSNVYGDFVVQYVYSVVSVLGILVFLNKN